MNLRPLTILIVVLTFSCHPQERSTGQESNPDIIVIVADDLGFSDLGCYGSEITTPHLNQLAAKGLRFSTFYNNAKCNPSRASLLTGTYPHEAGLGKSILRLGKKKIPGPYQGYLSHEVLTIAEALRKKPYRSYMSGKWHLGENPEDWPRQRGFDRYFGLISGASSYFEILKDQPRVRQMAMDDTPWEPVEEGFYMTDAITDQALDFIGQHNKDSSYFLYLAYTAPHWPLHAPADLIEKYREVYASGWDEIRTQRLVKMKALGIMDDHVQLSPRTASIIPWDETSDKETWIRRMQVHAAMIERMDEGIGKLWQLIRERGRSENTLIFFLSDNGASSENITGRKLHRKGIPIGLKGSYQAFREPWANVANSPFRLYKSMVHEGGIRTPLIAYWPKYITQPGRVTHTAGHVMDILPTILDITGTDLPEYPDLRPLRGRSLLPALKKEEKAKTRTLFWEYDGHRAVLQDGWKAISPRGKSWELYHLDKDPTELVNLSSKEPNIVDKLDKLYKKWAREVGIAP